MSSLWDLIVERSKLVGTDHEHVVCLECPIRERCDQQSLWCGVRLKTKPNWQQKRKIRNERKKARKRQNEPYRRRYLREYRREKKAETILKELG